MGGSATPVAECPWHWAKYFNSALNGNQVGAQGWQLELMLTGSVRKIRVETPITSFSPDEYQ